MKKNLNLYNYGNFNQIDKESKSMLPWKYGGIADIPTESIYNFYLFIIPYLNCTGVIAFSSKRVRSGKPFLTKFHSSTRIYRNFALRIFWQSVTRKEKR